MEEVTLIALPEDMHNGQSKPVQLHSYLDPAKREPTCPFSPACQAIRGRLICSPFPCWLLTNFRAGPDTHAVRILRWQSRLLIGQAVLSCNVQPGSFALVVFVHAVVELLGSRFAGLADATLHTQISVNTDVFVSYHHTAAEPADVTFNLRDFRVMLAWCTAMDMDMTIRFLSPGAPLLVEPHCSHAVSFPLLPLEHNPTDTSNLSWLQI